MGADCGQGKQVVEVLKLHEPGVNADCPSSSSYSSSSAPPTMITLEVVTLRVGYAQKLPTNRADSRALFVGATGDDS
jgi:hypothetical protein